MSQYIENGEAKANVQDHVPNTNDTEAVTLDQALIKCNNSQDTQCAELLQEIIQQRIAIIVNGNRGSPVSIRNLPPIYRVCFDGINLIQYDPDEYICCYGKLTPSNGYEQCCNKTVIDSTTTFCCNDVIYKKTESNACCGAHLYNTSSHICCKGTLQENFTGATCCDNQVFNTQKQTCCFDRRVFNKTQGDSCCGDHVYNSTTHLCCETTVHLTYTGTKRKTDKCCGNQSFHSECYRCIGSELSPIHQDMLCCDGAFKERKYGNATVCCQKEIIDSSTEICREGEVNQRNQTTNKLSGAAYDNSADEDRITEDGHTPVARKSGIKTFIIILISAGSSVIAIVTAIGVCVWRYRRRCKYEMSINQSCQSGSHLVPYTARPELLKNNLDSSEPLLITHCFNVETIMMNGHDLRKENTLTFVNDKSEYYKCSGTQTYANKISNCRNILGQPFDYAELLSLNKSTLQMPKSEVKMTLPHSILRDCSVEVNATTFRSISDLQKKLDISPVEKIASPVVEYVITGHTVLNDYAVVVMPFIGNEEDLIVRKFKSDGGLKEVADNRVVPKQGKTNEELEMYYLIKGSFVYIYTKSFSGFYCTTCKHTRTLKLRAFVYGSYKRFLDPLRYEVRLMMYIADDILKFADYKERMNENEAAQGRILKKEHLLKLPKFLTDNDSIHATVTPTDSHDNMWTHKLHPRLGGPICDANQKLDLSEVVEKCNDCPGCHLVHNEVPNCMEWYLVCSEQGVCPSYIFQCLVDISITGNAGNSNAITMPDCIVIDELQLRQEDRYPIEEGDYHTRCIRGVKEYLSDGILPSKRTELLKKLSPQPQLTGLSIEDVFFTLQEKYTSKGLLEAIATAMKSLHLYDDIDKLTNCGYLPRTLSTMPVPSVTVELPPNPESLIYSRLPAPEEPQGAVGGVHVRGEQLTLQQPRPELSHPNNDSQSIEGSTIKKGKEELNITSSNHYIYSEMGQVRREIDTHIHDVSSEETIRELPTPEHASLEETHVKQ